MLLLRNNHRRTLANRFAGWSQIILNHRCRSHSLAELRRDRPRWPLDAERLTRRARSCRELLRDRGHRRCPRFRRRPALLIEGVIRPARTLSSIRAAPPAGGPGARMAEAPGPVPLTGGPAHWAAQRSGPGLRLGPGSREMPGGYAPSWRALDRLNEAVRAGQPITSGPSVMLSTRSAASRPWRTRQ
jgi:hypothetical protein